MSPTPELFASANGLRVTHADIGTPYYGIACGDIMLASDALLPPSVDFVVGNLTQRMSVIRQRPFAGSTRARLVGGGGGWGRNVPARLYQNPAGVPLASILRDVSIEVGETVVLAAARTVGLFYAREAAPAERVLRQLAGSIWYMSPGGVTQVGPRPALKIKSAATVEDLDGAKGWLTVATEDPASWLPGATYTSPTVPGGLTVAATRLRTDSGGVLRLEVLTVDGVIPGGSVTPDNVTPADRTMAALRSLMRSEDPGRVPGGGPWEYQIERADALTFDGSPTSQDFPLPPVVNVPYSPALAGTSCVPTKGTLAYVDFVNRDPGRPMLRGFGTTLPSKTTIDATGTIEMGASAGAVNINTSARVGDPLSAVAVAGAPAVATNLAALATALAPIFTAFNGATVGTPVLAVAVVPFVPTSTAVAKLTSE